MTVWIETEPDGDYGVRVANVYADRETAYAAVRAKLRAAGGWYAECSEFDLENYVFDRLNEHEVISGSKQ